MIRAARKALRAVEALKRKRKFHSEPSEESLVSASKLPGWQSEMFRVAQHDKDGAASTVNVLSIPIARRNRRTASRKFGCARGDIVQRVRMGICAAVPAR